MSYIYVITNDINNKQYVGKTNKNIEERFKEHIKDSKKEQYKKRPLYNAINKYGIEHFSIKQLEECNFAESSIKEIYWIGKLNTYKNGYNATLGGDSKNLYNYQEIADLYEKNNISIAKLAKQIQCDEHTISTALKQCGVKIKPASTFFSKKVAQLDKKTNNIINIYASCEEAERSFEKRGGHISQVCKGQRQSAYGYKWKYID